MRQSRLLLVEDDSRFNAALARSLRRVHRVDQVTTLAGAYNHLADASVPYDVVILDRVLPDGDGLELLSFVRRSIPETKICVTSTKDALAEKLRGLQDGADAYLPKPVQPEEVVVHIDVLLRRGLLRHESWLLCRGLRLNESARLFARGQQVIRLSRRETQLLQLFFQGQGRATHERIRSFYWELGLDANNSLIHVSIRRLRRKLEPLNVRLATLYGQGYELAV